MAKIKIPDMEITADTIVPGVVPPDKKPDTNVQAPASGQASGEGDVPLFFAISSAATPAPSTFSAIENVFSKSFCVAAGSTSGFRTGFRGGRCPIVGKYDAESGGI